MKGNLERFYSILDEFRHENCKIGDLVAVDSASRCYGTRFRASVAASESDASALDYSTTKNNNKESSKES